MNLKLDNPETAKLIYETIPKIQWVRWTWKRRLSIISLTSHWTFWMYELFDWYDVSRFLTLEEAMKAGDDLFNKLKK